MQVRAWTLARLGHGLRLYSYALASNIARILHMKITFQNWHSECTNSSDMFVFLFCFFLFSAFFFQFFFYVLGVLFFLLRVRTMVVGTQWLVLMYVFITVKYICILFCIIEFALGILLLAGLQVLFLGGLVQEKWIHFKFVWVGLKLRVQDCYIIKVFFILYYM